MTTDCAWCQGTRNKLLNVRLGGGPVDGKNRHVAKKTIENASKRKTAFNEGFILKL